MLDIVAESKELEQELEQQKMETRRERRERIREESHRGLTAEERQLLMLKKKERLAKEDIKRTTRSSSRSRNRSSLEDALYKMKEATDGGRD